MSKFLLDILMATLPELIYKRVYSAERDISENRSNSYYSKYIEKLREERKTYIQLKDFAGESGWIFLDDFNDAKNGVKFTLACASYEHGFQDAMLCFTLLGKEGNLWEN